MEEKVISVERGALILIDIMHEKGLINDKTYQNIQMKYRTDTDKKYNFTPKFA